MFCHMPESTIFSKLSTVATRMHYNSWYNNYCLLNKRTFRMFLDIWMFGGEKKTWRSQSFYSFMVRKEFMMTIKLLRFLCADSTINYWFSSSSRNDLREMESGLTKANDKTDTFCPFEWIKTILPAPNLPSPLEWI